MIFILAQASKESHSDYTCYLLKIDLKFTDVTLIPQLCRTLTLIPSAGAVPTFTIPRSDLGENAIIVPALRRFSLATKVVFKGHHMPEIFCIRLSLDTVSDSEPLELDEESPTGTKREDIDSTQTPCLTASAPGELEAVKLPDLDLGLANDWGRKSIKWVQSSGILRSSRVVIKAWGSNGCRLFVVDFVRSSEMSWDLDSAVYAFICIHPRRRSPSSTVADWDNG